MEAEPKTLGMSPAPTPFDIAISQKLRDFLQQNGVFETEIESNHRKLIVNKLDKLLKDWIASLGKSKNVDRDQSGIYGGKVYTFGSYYLGVHSKGADIDALCVAPMHVDRDDFFASFYKVLAAQTEITELRAIEAAFVPVIKMNFDGIDVDLLFARMNLERVPDDLDLRSIEILKTLDQKCVRSLNGFRVTDEILHLVPNKANFRLALRAIKLWAKRRGVYSNVLGYFGGVTWALLVAKTCQLYPNAAAATIVHKFFFVFSLHWKWPNPVLLKALGENLLKYQVWDPRVNPADRFHLMPIVTPSYPQQNSTYNVTQSTKQIILKELNQGLATSYDIMDGKDDWSKLFAPINFFENYRHFVVLTASAGSKEDHLNFSGLVESRLRHLVAVLEKHRHVKIAHVNPKAYSESGLKCFWIIGLLFEKVPNLTVDLTCEMLYFTENVMKRAGHHCHVDVRYVRRRQLASSFPGIFEPVGPKPGNKPLHVTKSCKRQSDCEVMLPGKRRCLSKTGNSSPFSNCEEPSPEPVSYWVLKEPIKLNLLKH